MARNRVIYQTDLLYIGPTGGNNGTGSHYTTVTWGNNAGQAAGQNLVAELFRVQRADYNWSRTLRDVNQFGELAAIDRVSIDQPTVGLTFSYLLANMANEERLGFDVSNGNTIQSQISCISGITAGIKDTKNYFIKTVSDGNDAIDNSETNSWVVAIGNGFISSYSTTAAVGGFPTSDVTVEGLNICAVQNVSGNKIPAVNPSDGAYITGWFYQLPTGISSIGNQPVSTTVNQGLSVLRPGDITFNLGLNAGDGIFQESDLKVQNYTISFNLTRENLEKIGSKYAFAKVITFPVTATMSVTANVGESQTGNLKEIVDNNTTFNPSVTLYKPGSTSEPAIARFQLKGAKLENQDISSSIGANKSLTLNFSTQVGGAQTTDVGVFMSGIVS